MKLEQIEREEQIGKEFLGRKASRVVEFKPGDSAMTFEAYYAADTFLKSLGYETGSMCGLDPIGFAHNCDYVAKWYNLSSSDKNSLDGIVLQMGGFREGSVLVVFFNEPHK